MKIVLISTYELGRQPFGLVSPAAWLRKRGHAVTCFDLTRQELDARAVGSAELVAIYLPMHTATRLACKLIPSLREQNGGAHICCYGLYAPMNAEYLESLGVGTILGGEFEGGLVRLAEQLAATRSRHGEAARVENGKKAPGPEKPQGYEDSALRYRDRDALKRIPTTRVASQTEPMISLERLKLEVPDRTGLAPIAKYAHLIVPGDGYRLMGSTESSRGCKHLCRHCPIVPVYNGVFRIVEREVVLADLRQQEQHLARLRDTGCLFVISAVESVNEEILERLDKGHTREDFLYVARKFRELGMTLHPTFVPFTPWTTMEGYLELLRVLAAAELIGNVAPIQLGIRLLIPKGSRLLELEEVRRGVGAFDAESLVYPWRNTDARVDALSDTVQSIAAEADRKKESRVAAFARIWESAHAAAGVVAPELRVTEGCGVPFLSEPWYCCAEPTRDQLVAIGGAAVARAPEKVVAADGFV